MKRKTNLYTLSKDELWDEIDTLFSLITKEGYPVRNGLNNYYEELREEIKRRN